MSSPYFIQLHISQPNLSHLSRAPAYVNHWMSLFVGDNYKYPAVAMHELGHNLNLAHSGGLNGMTYTDHTCLMGNPLFLDDVGRMVRKSESAFLCISPLIFNCISHNPISLLSLQCFNPAKNFQIAKSGR